MTLGSLCTPKNLSVICTGKKYDGVSKQFTRTSTSPILGRDLINRSVFQAHPGRRGAGQEKKSRRIAASSNDRSVHALCSRERLSHIAVRNRRAKKNTFASSIGMEKNSRGEVAAGEIYLSSSILLLLFSGLSSLLLHFASSSSSLDLLFLRRGGLAGRTAH